MNILKKTAASAVSVILSLTFCVITVFAANEKVYLGGIPFGVKMMTGELTVVGFSDVETEIGKRCPALDAGLKEGDEIKYIGEKKLSFANELSDALNDSAGGSVELVCSRSGKDFTVSVTPVKSISDGRYKAGLQLKDNTSGIGTVTFIIPDTMAFAGLGHGICDRDTGEVERLNGGAVFPVEINSVDRGDEGKPGALIGKFKDDKTGTLISNTDSGVFGLLAYLPDPLSEGDLIETAPIGEVVEGEAKIRCTLDGKGMKLYDVTISEIDPDEKTNKNFVIKITDKELLKCAGGIVQGMSGSPIIQNGKLVGAVTHVFVSDPETGYGISVDNMMEALPELLR